MNLLFWGLTLGAVGKILIAVGILRVHYVMALEKRINEIVIRSFGFEKILTIFGVVLIIIGYLLEVYFYGGASLLTCTWDCNQVAGVILSQ